MTTPSRALAGPAWSLVAVNLAAPRIPDGNPGAGRNLLVPDPEGDSLGIGIELARAIDRISVWFGRIVAWLCFP